MPTSEFDLREAVRKASHELIFEGVLDKKNKYSFRINKSRTACWSFRPPHNIYIGDRCLNTTFCETAEDKSYYVESLVIHEVGHSLFTERDMRSFQTALRKADVSFDLFNLFEDARIERLMKEKMGGRPFRWKELDYDKDGYTKVKSGRGITVIGEDPSSNLVMSGGKTPWNRFYKFIACEGDAEDEEIKPFYERCLKAESSWEIIPICKEFLEKFPDAAKERGNGGGHSGSGGSGGSYFPQENDLSESIRLALDEDAADEAERDSEEVAGSNNSEGDQKNRGGGIVSAEDHGVPLKQFSSFNFSSLRCRHEFNFSLVGKITRKLEQLFEDRTSWASSAVPSKRINVRGLARGDSHNPYRKKEITRPGERTLALVIDCSGSMIGTPMENAGVMASAMSLLAKRSRLNGWLILSSDDGYQTFRLPVPDAAIADHFRSSGGGEGLANTFMATSRLLRQCDQVIVITDGMLTDGAIDKTPLHRAGIQTIGLYVGETYKAKRLDLWFDKTIVRETLMGAVDELVRRCK
jgi:hypothetical protein